MWNILPYTRIKAQEHVLFYKNNSAEFKIGTKRSCDVVSYQESLDIDGAKILVQWSKLDILEKTGCKNRKYLYDLTK